MNPNPDLDVDYIDYAQEFICERWNASLQGINQHWLLFALGVAAFVCVYQYLQMHTAAAAVVPALAVATDQAETTVDEKIAA